MAKAIIEFDLENHDDKLAHNRCIKSTDMAIVLFQISYNLKKKCEHIASCQEADSDIQDGVYIVFEEISKLIEEHGINLDELIE